jgi:hypothetical protein
MFTKFVFIDCLGNKYLAYLTPETAEMRIPELSDFGDLIDHLSGKRFNDISEAIEDLQREEKERLSGVEIR